MRNMGVCVLLLFSAIALGACSVNKYKTAPLQTGLSQSDTFVKGIWATKKAADAAQVGQNVGKAAGAASDTVNTVNKIQKAVPSSEKPE
jgi:hypothetical protein